MKTRNMGKKMPNLIGNDDDDDDGNSGYPRMDAYSNDISRGSVMDIRGEGKTKMISQKKRLFYTKQIRFPASREQHSLSKSVSFSL